MPILNYTTKIAPERTVAEIQTILARAGATSVSVDYDEAAVPIAVTFLVMVRDRPVNFRLPINYEGVLAKLKEDPKVPKRLKTEKQARRVAWRIVKDWVAAQMAFIEAEQGTLPQLFFPHAVDPRSGKTLYLQFEEEQRLLGDSGE